MSLREWKKIIVIQLLNSSIEKNRKHRQKERHQINGTGKTPFFDGN